MPTKAAVSGPPYLESNLKKPKNQYKRFFKELADNEQMIDRETELAKEESAGFQDLMIEIELLRLLKDDLSKALEEAGSSASSASNVDDGAPTYKEDVQKDDCEDDLYDSDGGVSIEW